MPSDSDNVPPRPAVPPRTQGRTGPTPDFMTYPYPDAEQILAHLETLPGATGETKGCIANLLNYRAVRTRARLPRGPSAAVLVPLFVGRSGDVYVLLSRRSDILKAFAGDTALPGGKVDAQDVTVEDTARREAFEEIGLPHDKARVPLLCVMEPHLVKGAMLVTPVVVLILDHGLQPNLNSSEVTSIFAQPLISFLSGSRTIDPNNPYHTFTDYPWSDGGTIRLHKFLTGREGQGVKPVSGLTASILIKTATIGYGRTPDFEVQPANAPTSAQQIAYALLTPANPLRIACEREGVDANKAAARLLRPPLAANAARTVEWGKIGMKWKKLMNSSSAAGVTAVGNARGSDSTARNPGGEHRVEEIEKRAREYGAEELGAKMEAYKKQARERKERTGENGEERRGAIPVLAKLGAYLDETRDMVNERMKEVKGDEKKLAKARKAYPKILEQVKKQLEGARDADGEFGPEALFALIPKEGLKGGKERMQNGRGKVEDGERREQDIEEGEEGTRRGLEEMGRSVGKDGEGHNPEQARIPEKRDAKL